MSGDEGGPLSTGNIEKGDVDADDTDDGLTVEEPAEKPERLRQRSAKKLSYAEDADEEMDWESDEGRDIEQFSSKAKKKQQKADSCSVCNLGDKLMFCYTCPEAYHPSCLTPPLKVAPRSKWSCPRCVDPMSEIDKFLDCQMRPQENLEGSDTSKESSTQYLVKWKSRSYLHCSWVPETELEKAVKSYSGLKMKLNNFRRQLDSLKGLNAIEDEWTPIRPEWTTVEKVLDSRQTGDVKEYLVKWKELGYEDVSWEVEEDIATFQAQIDRFNKIKIRQAVSSIINPKKRKGPGNEKETFKKRKEFKAFEETPKGLTGGVLHPYQLEGLNFLRFARQQGQHVILADEMGLGKTIQSIAFLASLMEEGASIPHLVVAPLSTLRNWEREFSTWVPHINVVMYVGSAQARAVIRDLEFYFPKEKVPQRKKKLKKKRKPMTVAKQSKQDRIKFDVLLTSYEMINFDSTILKAIKWECLIVDEGHRLKNKDSKLFQTLHQYTTRHRVLLTGTPLQNNLDELFMLMHFLDAGKFANLEDFQEEFKDLNQEEQVGRLHKMLAPHLLRRVKKDVMKDLPPKKELILRVELSSLQKEYYKAILTRNYQLLSRKGGPQISLNNVVMELRKLCGHPYLLSGVEEEIKRFKDTYRQLLEASGKLVLMDKMMVKLKEQGHRVLIYSQFKIMLDIIEDWLNMKFKQIFAPAWTTNTFEVDVMIAWNQLSAMNGESLEEYNAKFLDALLPVSSFKVVPLAEQIEKYCCGLPKGIKKYHGMPQSIVSDRDPCMTSLFWKALFENMGTTLKFSSSFHPQTDGQSEKANSTVLDLLKCYVSEHKATWEHYLPLVEYAYNNTVHTSTGKAPFEIVEGSKKIELALKKTQSKQKKADDCHRRELVFTLGDWVLLRFEKASDVAYRLKLPEGWKIHNAFHVSLLRPFVGDMPEGMVPEEQPDVEELDEILVSEQILAHKDRKVRGKVARRYSVKFKNYSPMDAKWMEEAELVDSPQLLQMYLEAFQLQPTVTMKFIASML
ncbi:hypothetical protein L7F22_030364 [Adiantum nelumboides]|nr:hypothetical protein [Adiantum nelumboides]